MLDVFQYRLAENLARQAAQSVNPIQDSSLTAFEKTGFPVRINGYAEIYPILNSMQGSNAFDVYMRELDGVTEQEFNLIVSVLCRYVSFHRFLFGDKKINIPFGEIISSFAVCRKAFCLSSSPPKKVFEIGAGAGYNSFFMQYFPDLETYAQVEACESFYLLQSALGKFLYKEAAHEFAVPSHQDSISYFTDINDQDSSNLGVDMNKAVNEGLSNRKKFYHYPWWKTEKIQELGNFDVVMSNANVCEFSHGALRIYLSLIYKVLSDNGIVVMQGMGMGNVEDWHRVLRSVLDAGMIPLAFIHGCGDYNIKFNDENITRYIATQNVVLIKDRSILYGEAENGFNAAQNKFNYSTNTAKVVEAYYSRPPGRVNYSREDIIKAVAHRVSQGNFG